MVVVRIPLFAPPVLRLALRVYPIVPGDALGVVLVPLLLVLVIGAG